MAPILDFRDSDARPRPGCRGISMMRLASRAIPMSCLQAPRAAPRLGWEYQGARSYPAAEIRTIGAFRVAPVGFAPTFFERHQGRTLAINGLDLATNSHTVGTRHQWSGKPAEGYPALAALIAGAAAPASPMGFVSFGGYDVTAGAAAPTRLGNVAWVERIASPNRIDPANTEERFHSDATWDRIRAAQARRRESLEAGDLLPGARDALGRLFAARTGPNELKALTAMLPEQLEADALKRQVQLAFATFRAGLGKAASLVLGGFDTHADHDNRQGQKMDQLLQGVDFAWEEAARSGLADQLVMVVGSDFARTPGYNAGKGKDHWSIGSVLLMGTGIPGNRVIGATTARQGARSVDPVTLEPVDSGGVRIQPVHVHRALRKLAGVAGHALAAERFPLTVSEDLPLLG